jgi:hypothetical protein
MEWTTLIWVALAVFMVVNMVRGGGCCGGQHGASFERRAKASRSVVKAERRDGCGAPPKQKVQGGAP